MQDVIVEIVIMVIATVIVIVEDLAAIHPIGVKTESLHPWSAEEGHVLHQPGSGGWMSIQTHTEGAGITPEFARHSPKLRNINFVFDVGYQDLSTFAHLFSTNTCP